MDDLFNSIKAALYERLENPLLQAFSISWIIWNSKLVLLYLKTDHWSDFKYELENHQESTLSLIISDSQWQYLAGSIANNLVAPTVITLFIIYVLPEISRRIYEKSLDSKRKLRDTRNEVEKLTLLTEEESQELRLRISTLEGEVKKRTSELQKTIEDLEEQNKKLINEKNQKSPPPPASSQNHDTANNELNDENVELGHIDRLILHTLNKAPEPFAIRDVIKKMNDYNDKVYYALETVQDSLDSLTDLSLIDEDFKGAGLTHYRISPFGEAYIRNHKRQFSRASLAS